MSVQPNNYCLVFTVFMLDVNMWRYSVAGILSIEDINANALAQTPVTDAEWLNFYEYTATRLDFFFIHDEFTS